MFRLLCIPLLFIILSSCFSGVEEIERTPEEVLNVVRLRAYNYAKECVYGKRGIAPITFESIEWVVYPGDYLFQLYDFKTGKNLRVLGFYEPPTKKIWIASKYESVEWVLAHEIVHAFGYTGHDWDPFGRCALLPEHRGLR
jgi:hypothetical protein